MPETIIANSRVKAVLGVGMEDTTLALGHVEIEVPVGSPRGEMSVRLVGLWIWNSNVWVQAWA